MSEYKLGEMYYAYLNGEDCEQKGIRPVVIMQSMKGGKYSPTIYVAPLTSSENKIKKHCINPLPMHVLLNAKQYCLPKDSIVLYEQARPISRQSILEKIEAPILPIEVMKKIAIAHATNVPIIGYLDFDSLNKLIVKLRSNNNICV